MTYTHKIYWNHHYVGAEDAFDTTRKSENIVNTIGANNITDPHHMIHVADKAIRHGLDIDYYGALKTGIPSQLANSNGFNWEPGIWEMARNSTAGVIAATQTALNQGIAGSLSSGLHHADQNTGAGYCTVNGLAITANWYNDTHITILDFDAHCGGGTVRSLRHYGIDHRVEQYDISTNKYDSYREDETHTINIVKNDNQYLRYVDQTLENINPNTDLILYNAGTDPYPIISYATMQQRDSMVFMHAKATNTPIAYVLAGGYTWEQTMADLVQTHISTIEAAEHAHTMTRHYIPTPVS